MNIISKALQSTTKRNTECKAQYIFDISFDNPLKMKCVQTAEEEWKVFDFDKKNRIGKYDKKWASL